MRKFFTYILLIIIPITAWNQEYLTGTLSNQAIKSYLNKTESSPSLKSSVQKYSPLLLPFRDDFSGSSVYPDTSKWVDNYTYINGEYPVFPVNRGVATFDVLNARGDLYSNAGTFPFIADYMTSYPIRLDSVYDESIGGLRKITPADSVYLSFYYQPQGYGDIPLTDDSLVLEFGYYDTLTVFSHVDSVLVYASDIPGIDTVGYFTPGTILHPQVPCNALLSLTLADTLFPGDSIVLPCDSVFTVKGASVFSHIDSNFIKVTSSIYPDIDSLGYFPPGSLIQSPYPCDTSMRLLLSDTLFVNDTIAVPCDSVFVYKNNWTHIWSAKGDSLSKFLINNDVYFKRVMIPITDTNWFKKDFQFRFYNYGSLSDIPSWQSNTDHWNIDEVYLNIGRSKNDIYSREVKFVQPPESFIKDFYSMPFRQYSGKLQKDSLQVYVNNTDSVAHNCSYHYQVYDPDENLLESFAYSTQDVLQPLSSMTVNTYSPFVKPPMKGFFEYFGSGEPDFRIDQVVNETDSVTIGDTLAFVQHFSNYMAYDDGSAERSYGSSVAGGEFVVKFATELDDTLRGIQIFFNKVKNNNNDRYFHIVVLNDNNGKPGVQRYEMKNQIPVFSGLNEFHTYVIPSDTLIKLPVGVFYVGIIQTTSDNLNIGFDRNTNTRKKIFYLSENGWVNSSFDGSLMIRPVLGPPIAGSSTGTKSTQAELKIFPNPPVNSGSIQISLPSEASDPKYRKYLTLQIFDLSGRLLYKAPFNEELKTSWFEPGFYIVDVFNEAFTKHYTAKLLITK